MTRDEMIAEAQRMRAEGCTLAVIAAALGYRQPNSAWRLLNPEGSRAIDQRSNTKRAPAKRAWENEHDRGRCLCGAATTVGAERRGYTLCADCRREVLHVGRAMRHERIAEMWLRGSSLAEIAATLDSTPARIGVAMAAMRRDGWDLPYRRPGWTRRAAA